MQQVKTAIFYLFIGLQICTAQTKANQETLHIEDFNWTVPIPENFTPVEKSAWGKLSKKNIEILGEDIRNQEVTIFAYQHNKFNKFDAVWQPYDAEICGDYFELNAEANTVMHQMYESQLPGANFDSISKKQSISGLEFERFDVTIDFPDVIKMKVIRFYRLFGDKQYNMYITIIDEKVGERMLAAFLNSKFE